MAATAHGMGDLESLAREVREAFRKWRQPPLIPEQAEQIAVYLELLGRWNEAVSLTAIRDRPTAILRHFVEPMMAIPLLGGAGPVLLDAGSGAGFPGLPLKIFEPDRSCLLVEANSRKAAFLREVVAALELENVDVLEGRLEEQVLAGEVPGPVHVLTARAWSAWGGLLGIGAGLMAPGGRAIFFVGDETLRALRRHLVTDPGGSAPKAGSAGEWGPAKRAGWSIRRVIPLPHLDRGAVVALELPSEQ